MFLQHFLKNIRISEGYVNQEHNSPYLPSSILRRYNNSYYGPKVRKKTRSNGGEINNQKKKKKNFGLSQLNYHQLKYYLQFKSYFKSI